MTAPRPGLAAPPPDPAPPLPASRARSFFQWQWILLCTGVAGGVAAAIATPARADAAARQDWAPFVLVAGLLLIGLVAAGDGLFRAAGERLARAAPDGRVLFLGVVALIVVVTAVLNLDTSVAFLTPVMVHTARQRKQEGGALLCACVLLSNAGSLLLPGSNLTNLIVLGQLHLRGSAFPARMFLPWVVAITVTALVVGVGGRRELRSRRETPPSGEHPVLGIGLVAVVAAAALVVSLPNPALPVAAVAVGAAGMRLTAGRQRLGEVVEVVGFPVLVGLFGVAVALGTLGRSWSGPAQLLTHLDAWGTAGLGVAASVLLNNLPAASLLAARAPHHPLALLLGLNLGPNLFVTGSLAWVVWMQAARTAGAKPSVRQATKLGAISAPLALAAAVAVLTLVGKL